MSSAMPFFFNAVDLCIVVINRKPWTSAKEVCRALEYKNCRVRDVLKKQVSIEKKQHKHELEGRATVAHPQNGLKKDNLAITIPMRKRCPSQYFQVNSQKGKDFKKHCCNVLFPHGRQQLPNKMKEDHQQAIAGRDNQIQALEFINEEHQKKNLRLNKEIVDLIANRHRARRGFFDNVLFFIKKNSKKFHPYYVIPCQYKQLERT